MSQHDDLFQELGRTLEVSPSRDFAKGVHARISRRRLIVRATMSGFAIAASLMFAVVMRGPSTATIEEPSRMAETASPAPAVPIETPDSVTPAVARVTRVAASRPATVAPVVVADDRLLVVTNQMAVLQAAWANQQVTAGETEVPVVDTPMATEVTPVVVEPVRVLPVVIVDYRPSTERIPIIRRAVAALETK